jgi:hypothetical protein
MLGYVIDMDVLCGTERSDDDSIVLEETMPVQDPSPNQSPSKNPVMATPTRKIEHHHLPPFVYSMAQAYDDHQLQDSCESENPAVTSPKRKIDLPSLPPSVYIMAQAYDILQSQSQSPTKLNQNESGGERLSKSNPTSSPGKK